MMVGVPPLPLPCLHSSGSGSLRLTIVYLLLNKLSGVIKYGCVCVESDYFMSEMAELSVIQLGDSCWPDLILVEFCVL
jgi:hypothetical protein